MKLLVLIDSVQYVNGEIYQQHLHPVLQKMHDCTYVELNNTQSIFHDYDHVLSALKLRTLYANVDRVKQLIGTSSITVQDYDPWVSFEDGSHYKGAYDVISSRLNVKNFMLSSVEWSNVVKSRGLPAFGVQLGVSQETCKFTPWEERKLDVEFRGSWRESRQRNFDRLTQLGINDVWKRDFVNPYSAFLRYLDDLRVWVQFEGEPTIVDKQPIEYNALWPKAIEILSRGCFLVRNRQTEALHYKIDELPTACLVDDVEEMPSKIEWIKKLDPNVRNKMIAGTVEILKQRRYYEIIVEELTRRINE
jgi:hypothetical protein